MQLYSKEIQDFWDILAETINQVLDSREADQFSAEFLLNDYRDKLSRIDEHLTFHFEADEEGPIEMIFGCDGYPESIHAVLTIVEAAPEIEGVTFKAFNHRYDPVPNCINVADEMCDIADFWCQLKKIDNKLHLSIYMHEVPDILETEPRVEAVMIFLDALIGEYELMTKIWALDWVNMPSDPVDYGLMPLADLRECFDRLKGNVSAIGITFH